MNKQILSFVICGILFFTASQTLAQEVTDRNVQQRTPIHTFGETAHVAFMGGSITEMNGFRPMVCEMLEKRFPKTKFTFTAAGLSSTSSVTGAFRLEQDVLSKGNVDLFFVEFAVNDDQDAHYDEQTAIRGMEGIIRHLRRKNPSADIVMIFFVNEHLIEEYRNGKEAVSIAAHRKTAEHYGISTVNVAREVQQQIDEKKLTWEQFGGVHPAAYGNRLAANMIAYLFNNLSPRETTDNEKTQTLPPALDSLSYENGHFLSPETAKHGSAWTWSVPDWKNISGSFRQTFAGQKLLCCSTPNESAAIEFEGRAIGAFVLAGPDAGTLEYQIDNKPPAKIILYHDYSQGLHYPRTVIFDDELNAGKHTLRFQLQTAPPPKSQGTTARILQFVVND